MPVRDPAMMLPRPLPRTIWLAGMIVCLLGFITCLVILLAPYSLVRSALDSLAPDGQAEFFTIARHTQLRSWAQVMGVFLGISVTLGFSLRTRILSGLEHLQPGTKRTIQLLRRDLVNLGQALILSDSAQDGSQRKWYLLALLFITFLAAFIRLAYLFAPIRYDEAYSFLVFAMQPVKVIVRDYHVPNNHIFHTLLMRAAYLLTGSQIWSLRLPVWIAGVLLVPASYMVAALAFGKGALAFGKGALAFGKGALAFGKGAPAVNQNTLEFDEAVHHPNHAAGLLASAFVTASSTLIDFSTNARGYMWVCLLTMVILWLAICLKEQHNRAAWILLAVFSALGFFTIPIFLYPFGMVMGWLLVSWLVKDTGSASSHDDGRSQFFWAWLATGLATGILVFLLYLPLIRAGGLNDLLGNRFVSAVEATGFSENILARVRASWSDWVRDLPFLLTMALVIGFLTAMFSSKRLTGSRLPFPLVGLAWIVIMVGLQRVTPWPRIWVFLLPIFLVWSAGGLVAVARAPLPEARAPLPEARAPLPKVRATPALMRLPQRMRTGIYLVSVCLLAIGLTWNVYQKGSILDPSQALGRAHPEEQEAAIFLAGEVGNGDVIGTAIPVNFPLRYYLLLEGISEEYLFRKTRDKGFERALIVVHQGYGQTLAEVLKKTKLDEFVDQEQARLIHEYHSSQVFEIIRR